MTISAEMKFSDAAHSWLEMRDAGTSRAHRAHKRYSSENNPRIKDCLRTIS